MFILIILNSGRSSAQNAKTDSLLSILRNTNEDTTKVKTLNDLSDRLYLNGEYDNAITYAQQAKTIAEKIVIPLQANRGWAKGIARSLNNIGVIYKEQGNYPKALELYFKALKIYENIRQSDGTLGSKKNIATLLMNIGNIYYYQDDIDKTLEYYQKSLIIRKEIGDNKGIAISLNNIANIYGNQGDYPKALEQYFIALDIFEEIKDNGNIAASISNIGDIYMNQGKTKEALQQFFKSLKIMEEMGDKNGVTAAYINLGSIYTDIKKYSEAEKYLNKALSLSKEIGNKEAIKSTYDNLSKLNSITGNWRLAYDYHKLYILYKDSLVNEENTRKSVRTEMNFAFNKKEYATRLEQEKKDIISKEENQKQTIVIASVSLGLVLVVILALVILRSLRQNQKKNKIITQQKELVENQKKTVEEKQKEVLDSIHYAKRIQTALITSEKYINKNLNRLMNN